jgi:uncharacterized damage-inducible protein DinB
MRLRRTALAFALTLVAAAPLSAQSVTADHHRDLNDVQKKFIDLAKAMPASTMNWRPGAGARTVNELMLHVIADNYLIPIAMGKPAPAASGITSDYNTAVAYEKKTMTRDQVIAELEASFVHLHQALALTTDSNLGEGIKFFGQDFTRHRAMLATVTHLHEHLGQFIAYARGNGVTPPWSR